MTDLAGAANALFSGEGTLTLFAPTTDAIHALPAEVVDRLTDPVFLPQLQDVLRYHVLDSGARAEDLVDGESVAAVNGKDIAINLNPLRLQDEANIIVVDIEAANGVVHGVDALLAPASLSPNIVDIAAGYDRFSFLVAAVTAADLGNGRTGETSNCPERIWERRTRWERGGARAGDGCAGDEGDGKGPARG